MGKTEKKSWGHYGQYMQSVAFAWVSEVPFILSPALLQGMVTGLLGCIPLLLPWRFPTVHHGWCPVQLISVCLCWDPLPHHAALWLSLGPMEIYSLLAFQRAEMHLAIPAAPSQLTPPPVPASHPFSQPAESQVPVLMGPDAKRHKTGSPKTLSIFYSANSNPLA